MADIELIIRIPEEFYEGLRKVDLMFKGQRNGKTLEAVIFDAVAKGTPLPKGHGDLIEKPTDEEITETIGGRNDFADCIREVVKVVFENAQTIIEADKESEEE